MAEGDTIHRLARRIEAGMAGELVSTVETPNPRSPLARTASRLEGTRIEGAEAFGKHLLIRFEGDLAIRSHLRMSGAWHLYRAGERWRKPRRGAWLVLQANGTEAVQFGGPELELVRASRVHRHPKLARLGPDILGPAFETAQGVTALRRAGAERELGDVFLDQRVIAGIGNIYKSEGCFEARLDPWRRMADLGEDELTSVVEATATLMRDGLEHGRQPKRVYRRAGRPCPRCRTPVRSRGQGDDNRTTYWCPGCQG